MVAARKKNAAPVPLSSRASSSLERTASMPASRLGSTRRTRLPKTSAPADEAYAGAPVAEDDEDQPRAGDGEHHQVERAADRGGVAPRGRPPGRVGSSSGSRPSTRRSAETAGTSSGGSRCLVAHRAVRLPAAPRCRRCWTAAWRGSSARRPWGSGRPSRPRPTRRGRRLRRCLPSTRLTPTSSTAAPGLTMSAVMMLGTPAAAITMSASRTCVARSRVPVWHRVTVAFSLRRVSSRPSGPPDGEAASDDDDLGALDLDAVTAQQLDRARRACTGAARPRRARACRG